jgi:S-adenosylmethionine/arginine decarboxylase-like enzyme
MVIEQEVLAWHFMATVRGVNPIMLTEPKVVSEVMELIRLKAGMKAIKGPDSTYVGDDDKAWGPGVTSFTLLVDSHMSLHCLANQAVAFFDMFSCKRVPIEDLMNTLALHLAGSGMASLWNRINNTCIWTGRW